MSMETEKGKALAVRVFAYQCRAFVVLYGGSKNLA